MARIRTIKPEFWTDGTILSLSYPARLFYIGTWNFALCDHGHLPDDARGLKFKILPADPVGGEDMLTELMDAGRITRITLPDGRTFLHVVRFEDHQKVDSRWTSRCPACTYLTETHPSSGETHDVLQKSHVGGEGKGRERKGGEGNVEAPSASTPPPRRCPEHLPVDNPPNCGRCKDARVTADAWAAAHPPALTLVPRKPVIHIDGVCDAHRQLEDTCEMCQREHIGKWATA